MKFILSVALLIAFSFPAFAGKPAAGKSSPSAMTDNIGDAASKAIGTCKGDKCGCKDKSCSCKDHEHHAKGEHKAGDGCECTCKDKACHQEKAS